MGVGIDDTADHLTCVIDPIGPGTINTKMGKDLHHSILPDEGLVTRVVPSDYLVGIVDIMGVRRTFETATYQ
ncbi:MAG: hypothetical protein B6D74_00960 [gamma proteobacterium symbiont of Ctena orbiculata]|nr:MAG: hypothetical protein B6D74_00960 [gamma proteobacterium symbiont of Ctena orbiculata]